MHLRQCRHDCRNVGWPMDGQFNILKAYFRQSEQTLLDPYLCQAISKSQSCSELLFINVKHALYTDLQTEV